LDCTGLGFVITGVESPNAVTRESVSETNVSETRYKAGSWIELALYRVLNVPYLLQHI
jgi:hypothetical protein